MTARHLIDSDDRPSGEQRPGQPVEVPAGAPGLLVRLKQAWAVLALLGAILAAGGALWAWSASHATKADLAREHELAAGAAVRVEKLEGKVADLGEDMRWLKAAVFEIAMRSGAKVDPPPP